VIVISGLVGVQKPDPAIYHIVLERLGVAPAEVIFVDDFVQNIETARALGMQTLHFRAGMDWRAELARRLDEGRMTHDG
jgi:FMN phosphatase YigB (HAD superfamily)